MRPFGVAAALLLLPVSFQAARIGEAQTDAAPRALAVSGAVRGTHDPAIGKDGDTYYLFVTGAGPRTGDVPLPSEPALRPQLPIRCSKDLVVWSRCGSVFPEIPEWIRKASPGTHDLWAPDISHVGDEFLLYYAFSIFGKNTSGIGLATNWTLDPASPNYKWVDRGPVLRSEADDDWNAIDPNLVVDDKGHRWLAYGSYWSGIKLRRLDDATGLAARHGKAYSLAGRGQEAWRESGRLEPTAEEAPFVFAHEGWYYLFVSWDFCCRGARSTYREMVGRSRKITGPYKDRDGKAMTDGGGTEVLTGNEIWAGPGGASLLHDADGDVIVFHAYSRADGHVALQISTVVWKDGWPEAAVRRVEDRDGGA